ncbi:hypothetical protein B566_EDAN012614, partial [Ephemera danica]
MPLAVLADPWQAVQLKEELEQRAVPSVCRVHVMLLRPPKLARATGWDGHRVLYVPLAPLEYLRPAGPAENAP